jgi:hypothetical protein
MRVSIARRQRIERGARASIERREHQWRREKHGLGETAPARWRAARRSVRQTVKMA